MSRADKCWDCMFKNPAKECASCLLRIGYGYRTIERLLRPFAKRASLVRWRRELQLPTSRRTTKVLFIGYVKKVKPPKPKKIKPVISEDERKLIAREYYRNNAARINQRDAARRRSDPQFRLLKALRLRTWKVITLRGGKKRHRTFDLAGCTPQFLHQWIESQFKARMSWSNYGKRWEVDHITPCSSFDLILESEQRKCFHYSNLRPLLKSANRQKHARIIPHQPQLLL